ncbi:MAG: hypothetical protein DMD26_09365 [Gemmatimonadetes bacterium]|nr:MAG: hypothetical protein DMD26_09365 [Gemmatimonadota bacterium]
MQAVPTELATQARLNDQWRRGLLVTDVAPSGPAYRELNENSSIIVRVLYPQKREIRSPADLEEAISGLKHGDLITLLVYEVRAQTTTSVTLKAQ